jgi:PAS domain S-box-containing protein
MIHSTAIIHEGKPVGLRGIALDITERKQMEEELRTSRERLEYVIASNPALIYLAKPLADFSDFYVTYVGKSTLPITGFESEELVEEKGNAFWASRVHPDDLVPYKASMAEFWRDGHRVWEYRFLHKNGTYRWLREEANVIRDTTGNINEIIGCWIDITERKRMEEELQAANQRLKYVVTSNPAVIYTGTPTSDCSNWHVTYLSDTVAAILGFEASDFIGHPEFWDSHIHPDDLRPTQKAISHIKEGHYACDYRFLHKDGRYRWTREEARLIRDIDGKPLEVIGYWSDITELKEMQNRLAETERLAAMGQAAAMVGHDLRNPLQATTGIIYLVKRLLDSEKLEGRKEALELLAELDSQVFYMDKIVSDLQDYARPLSDELVATNLPDLIQEVTSNVKIPEKVQVSTMIQGDVTQVIINRSLLRRVLVNLVMNAIQAMPNGGSLTINVNKTLDALVIAVKDSGVGIAEDDLGKLFHPFFTTKAQGQGLGLAVSKRLVEAQSGTITVQSELGKGSVFTVKIPAAWIN